MQPLKLVLRNQGTNGCIFYPGIKCNQSQLESRKHVTKIQTKKNSVNEIEIAKKIKQIPQYPFYFAPILESCGISLATIDKQEIQKCNMVSHEIAKKKNTQFVSSKIRYLGNKTLSDYLLLWLKKHYISKLLESHLHLLESLDKLLKKDIVHFDIKGNNIMYDRINDVPIIIDFGMSIPIKTLDIENYKSFFPVLYEEYFPWCIEIILMCYITKHRKPTQESYLEKVKETELDEMKHHCTIYIEKNPIMQISQTTNEERKEMKTRLHQWIDGWKNKTWDVIAKQLISTYSSWDNYSLAGIYLLEFDDLFSNDNETQGTQETQETQEIPLLIIEYSKILKNIILSDPKMRPTALSTVLSIKNRFKKISKTEYNQFIHILNDKIKKKHFFSTLQHKKNERTLKYLEQSNQINQ